LRRWRISRPKRTRYDLADGNDGSGVSIRRIEAMCEWHEKRKASHGVHRERPQRSLIRMR
jgi:hypothetical protein